MFGVVLAMIGAITVVLSSNTSDTRLSPEELFKAVSQHAFLIFSAIYVICVSVLTGLSEGSVGRRWVLVDVGLCALFGT
jgi:Fe2+ transport system protein B